MRELEMIFKLLTDLWKFIKDYQGIPLNDDICREVREAQESSTRRFEGIKNVHELASKLFSAALGYLLESDEERIDKYNG